MNLLVLNFEFLEKNQETKMCGLKKKMNLLVLNLEFLEKNQETKVRGLKKKKHEFAGLSLHLISSWIGIWFF